MPGYDIYGPIYVHHINPITVEQVLSRDPLLFDPENVICVSTAMHEAIHYGNRCPIEDPVERVPNDTTLWKKGTP